MKRFVLLLKICIFRFCCIFLAKLRILLGHSTDSGFFILWKLCFFLILTNKNHAIPLKNALIQALSAKICNFPLFFATFNLNCGYFCKILLRFCLMYNHYYIHFYSTLFLSLCFLQLAPNINVSKQIHLITVHAQNIIVVGNSWIRCSLKICW